jgi:hypothetical protein
MLEFMKMGGFMMWPLLAAGVLAIVAAARQTMHGEGAPALDPSRLARAVLAGSFAWAGLGFVIVTKYSGMETGFGMRTSPSVILTGLGEAACPAVLGLAVFAIVAGIRSFSTARAVSGPGPV